jgi:hypothetical protein
MRSAEAGGMKTERHRAGVWPYLLGLVPLLMGVSCATATHQAIDSGPMAAAR